MVACFGMADARGLIKVTDYLKKAEMVLENYKLLRESLEHIDHRIRKLSKMGAPKEITAIDISAVSGTGRMTTEAILNEIAEKQNEREATVQAIQDIEQALTVISERKDCRDYRKLLIMWYVDELDKEKIINILGYSSRQSIYSRRNKALDKFAVVFFGAKAMNLEK